MSSSFKQPVQPNRNLREFNVGSSDEFHQEDPSDIAQFEQDVKAARAEKMSAVNKVSDQARKRIDILSNIGRLVKDVSIEGTVFTLRTLKAKEAREATTAAFTTALTQLDASFEMRKQQLARSIYKIDGHEMGAVLGNNSIDAVLSFIENDLEEVVFNKLFDEYNALKKEVQTKYGINSDEEVKEVIEDLKK